VKAYGLRKKMSAGVRRRIVLELAGAALLHLTMAFVLGWRHYLLFVIAPMVTSLYVASVLRSVMEYHDVTEGSEWTNARSIVTHTLIEFLWSNVNYHLEHHLYPSVPYYVLPELRRALTTDYQAHQSNVENGYGHTALVLLRDPRHFAPK
jgi:fatty acid desaturase